MRFSAVFLSRRAPRLAATLPVALAFGAAFSAGVAHADSTTAPGIYGQFDRAGSKSDTRGLTIGVTAPIGLKASLWGTQIGAYWNLYAARLVAKAPDEVPGNDHYYTTLFGLTPTFRFRPGNGLSPWFADAGIGVSYTNKHYRSDVKEFSTRFNFGTTVGFGYSFGAARQHEISLHLEHFSNGSYRQPNPGENYVEVRYAHLF